MKILICPDSFKGSLSAIEVAKAIETGIKKEIDATCVLLPIADGGEGTMSAINTIKNGNLIEVLATDPLMEKIKATYSIIDNTTAVIEMASCAGLLLVPPEKRNPLYTTTFGVGELILDALNKNIKDIYLCIGGSSTNDCGIGCLSALGVKFLDKNGNSVSNDGSGLGHINSIDTSELDRRLKDVKFTILSDVDNPLFGKNGAAYVYAPQKGATKEIVEILDNNLKHFAEIIKDTYNVDLEHKKYAGAAGGFASGISVFLNTEIISGSEAILKLANFKELISDIDLIYTGEGAVDSQTLNGKVVMGILREVKNIPVIVIGGLVTDEAYELLNKGATSIFSIVNGPITLKEAMSNAPKLIENLVRQTIRLVNI